jgi:hypothetical protein
MSNNSERQEPDSTDKKEMTSNAENQSRIDALATELDAFLKPGGSMLITELEKQDSDFLRSARHLIRLKNIQLTSMLVKLQLQELAEKDDYISKLTVQSTSAVGDATTKPTKSTPKLRNVSVSPAPISQQKNATQNGK